VFGANPVPVSIPCPTCGATPSIVVFRYFDTAALFCRACESAWTEEAQRHPELRDIKPEHEKH
jgi:hypothetical protein